MLGKPNIRQRRGHRISGKSNRNLLQGKGRNVPRCKGFGDDEKSADSRRAYAFDSVNKASRVSLEKTTVSSRQAFSVCLEEIGNMTDWFGEDLISVHPEESVHEVYSRCVDAIRAMSKPIEKVYLADRLYFEEDSLSVLKIIQRALPDDFKIPDVMHDKNVTSVIKFIEGYLAELSGVKDMTLDVDRSEEIVYLIGDSLGSHMSLINVHDFVSEIKSSGEHTDFCLNVLRLLVKMGFSVDDGADYSMGFTDMMIENFNMEVDCLDGEEEMEDLDFTFINELQEGGKDLNSIDLKSDLSVDTLSHLIFEYLHTDKFIESNLQKYRFVLQEVLNVRDFISTECSLLEKGQIDLEEDYPEGIFPIQQYFAIYNVNPEFQGVFDEELSTLLNSWCCNYMAEELYAITSIETLIAKNDALSVKKNLIQDALNAFGSLINITG